MRVCLDTNSLLPLFGNRSPFADIKDALLTGGLELAVSTAILLEYEEVVTRLSGQERWNQIAALFDQLEELHGTILRIDSSFQFHVITTDPDDNKFVDCAIAAHAEFIVTDDQHFAPLATSGFSPRVVTLEGLGAELARRKPPANPRGPGGND
jgi:putative PIN family toxin of toxin-antitoxin system